jgi:hypothetical protein
MKTYEVEVRRISYMTVFVEAENEEDAEVKAWDKVGSSEDDICDSDWYLESVKETFE